MIYKFYRKIKRIKYIKELLKKYTPRKTLQMTKKYVKGDDVENKKIF